MLREKQQQKVAARDQNDLCVKEVTAIVVDWSDKTHRRNKNTQCVCGDTASKSSIEEK